MSHSTFKMPAEGKLSSWKKQHNEIHKITPDPSRPEIFCIVRHPRLLDISSSSELGGTDVQKQGELQLRDCWLDGDSRILTDSELIRSASIKMGSIFRVYKVNVDFLPVTDEILKAIPTDKLERVKSDGEVRRLTVIIPGDKKDVKKSCFLAKPSLEDVEKASTSSDPIVVGTIYLQECWLSGCEDLKTGDDEIRFAAYLGAINIYRKYTAEVEKL